MVVQRDLFVYNDSEVIKSIISKSWLFRGIALFTMIAKLLKVLSPTVSVCTGQLYNNVVPVNLCLWSPNAGLIHDNYAV